LLLAAFTLMRQPGVTPMVVVRQESFQED